MASLSFIVSLYQLIYWKFLDTEQCDMPKKHAFRKLHGINQLTSAVGSFDSINYNYDTSDVSLRTSMRV